MILLNDFRSIKKLTQNVSMKNDAISIYIELLRGYFNLNTYKLILIDYPIFTVVLLFCLLNHSRNETTCQYCNTFVSFTCEVNGEV